MFPHEVSFRCTLPYFSLKISLSILCFVFLSLYSCFRFYFICLCAHFSLSNLKFLAIFPNIVAPIAAFPHISLSFLLLSLLSVIMSYLLDSLSEKKFLKKKFPFLLSSNLPLPKTISLSFASSCFFLLFFFALTSSLLTSVCIVLFTYYLKYPSSLSLSCFPIFLHFFSLCPYILSIRRHIFLSDLLRAFYLIFLIFYPIFLFSPISVPLLPFLSHFNSRNPILLHLGPPDLNETRPPAFFLLYTLHLFCSLLRVLLFVCFETRNPEYRVTVFTI